MPRKSNTRSAQGSGTIRQRADGRWEARYTVGRDPGTGKQIQKSVYGSTQREVSEKLRKITASIDDRSYQEPCKMRLKEWLDIWTSEYLGDVKPSTAHLYTEQVRLYIVPALGAVRLDELNTHNIQIVYNRLKRGQGGKPRTIAPAPSVMKLLRIQRARQLEQRLRVGELWQNSNMVFTNETGGYLSYRTVYDCFKRIVDRIGASNIRFHDLRHTYAVNAIRAGDDFKTLQENLGHATAAFTMQVYGHVTEQMKKDSSDRMEQFMKGISGL